MHATIISYQFLRSKNRFRSRYTRLRQPIGSANDQRLTTNDSLYAFALAFNLTCPPASSTENSTSWHPYCLRISSVFFCTKVENESRLPETFSPAFFLAVTSVLNKRSTCSRPALSAALCKVTGCEVTGASAGAVAA